MIRTRLRSQPRFIATLASVLAAGLLGAAGAHAAPTVNVKDMGELSPGLGSEANAINNASRAVGRAMSNADFQYRQVVWDGLKLQEFGSCCSGFLPTIRAINLPGEVVGDYRATKAHSIPVYWDSLGASLELPSLGPFGFGKAFSINDAGLIAGSSPDGAFDVHAVIWDKNKGIRDLGFLGDPEPGNPRFAEAHGINNVGEVVGQGSVGMEMDAFVWRDGVYTNLGQGNATHINDAGLIAGYTPGIIPVTWTNGVKKNLPALDGGKVAYGHLVNAINSAGDLVGYAPSPGAGVFTIAVLWRGGKIINLGHYPGGTNSYATGINDLGQIVGSGNLVPGGPHHALRWTVKGKKVAIELQ